MLLRVITDSKWKKTLVRNPSLLPADCLSDLRTSANTLSVWKVNNPEDEDELKELCMIQALCRDKLQKVSYVLLNEDSIKQIGIILKNDVGMCPCIINQQLLQKHIDLDQLDSKQLEKLAFIIREKVQSSSCTGIFTREDINTCIDNHIKCNDIDESQIKADFR